MEDVDDDNEGITESERDRILKHIAEEGEVLSDMRACIH